MTETEDDRERDRPFAKANEVAAITQTALNTRHSGDIVLSLFAGP